MPIITGRSPSRNVVDIAVDEDGQLLLGGAISSEVAIYTLRLDEVSDTLMYVGEAEEGSSEGDPVWRIKKVDMTSGVSITWEDGDSNFDNIWTGHAGGGRSYS